MSKQSDAHGLNASGCGSMERDAIPSSGGRPTNGGGNGSVSSRSSATPSAQSARRTERDRPAPGMVAAVCLGHTRGQIWGQQAGSPMPLRSLALMRGRHMSPLSPLSPLSLCPASIRRSGDGATIARASMPGYCRGKHCHRQPSVSRWSAVVKAGGRIRLSRTCRTAPGCALPSIHGQAFCARSARTPGAAGSRHRCAREEARSR